MLPGRNEMGSDNSLHASAYHSEYKHEFDLQLITLTNLQEVLGALKSSILVQALRFIYLKTALLRTGCCYLKYRSTGTKRIFHC